MQYNTMQENKKNIAIDLNISEVLVWLWYNNADLRREVALSIARILQVRNNQSNNWNRDLGTISQIILTWWNPSGDSMSEAEYMEEILKKWSIADIMKWVQIILEDSSQTTQENAQKVREKLADQQSITLIWEASHRERATQNFKEAWIPVTSYISTQSILPKPLWKNNTYFTKRHVGRWVQEQLWGAKKIVPQSFIDFLKIFFLK